MSRWSLTIFWIANVEDIISREVYDRSDKVKDFPLWKESSRKTDDTVMTIAVADALLKTRNKSNDEIKDTLIESMKKYGKLYPDEGYGVRFSFWLKLPNLVG